MMSMTYWNVTGVFFKPNGMLVICYRLWCIVKVVCSRTTLCTSICQEPPLASSVENAWAFSKELIHSFMPGNVYEICSLTVMSLRYHTKNRRILFFGDEHNRLGQLGLICFNNIHWQLVTDIVILEICCFRSSSVSDRVYPAFASGSNATHWVAVLCHISVHPTLTWTVWACEWSRRGVWPSYQVYWCSYAGLLLLESWRISMRMYDHCHFGKYWLLQPMTGPLLKPVVTRLGRGMGQIVSWSSPSNRFWYMDMLNGYVS